MINYTTNPVGYIPYEKITICSNTLIGGGNLISVGDIKPLFIGKGETPKIWLRAVSNLKNKEFVEIVTASEQNFPSVKVINRNNEIRILAENTVVLRAIYNSDSIEILKLDLRPLGLNVFGDKNGLITPQMTLTNNTFEGAGALLGIDM